MKTTKFKPSEVGPIPEEWEVKRLGDCAEIARGGSPRPIEAYLTTASNGLNWVKIGDVGVGAKYIERTEEKIKPEGLSSTRQVSAGDFVLSNSMSFGRPYIMKIDGCIHDGWLVIQDYRKQFETEYLFYSLGSEWVFRQYKTLAAGSSVLNLNKDVVARVVVPVPPRPEQEKIAEALSDVDGLLAAMTKLIEKKRAIKQGAMQQLLTGKKRLAGFTGKWVEKRFDECFDLVGNNTFAREFMCEDTHGIANIHYGDVLIRYGSVLDCSRTAVPSLLDSVACKTELLKEGDVIIADTAEDETVGKAIEIRGLKDRCAVAGLHTIACRPRFVFAAGWLGYYINSSAFHDQLLPLITGTKVSSISKAGLRTTVLHVPDLTEQKAIASVLSDMDAEIAALEAKRAKYESVKQGMMQELLTGKARLV